MTPVDDLTASLIQTEGADHCLGLKCHRTRKLTGVTTKVPVTEPQTAKTRDPDSEDAQSLQNPLFIRNIP